MNPLGRLRLHIARRRGIPARIEGIHQLISTGVPAHLDDLAAHVGTSVRNQGDVHRGETAQAFTDLGDEVRTSMRHLASSVEESNLRLSAGIDEMRTALDVQHADIEIQRAGLMALHADVVALRGVAESAHALLALAAEQRASTDERVAVAIHSSRVVLEAALADRRDCAAAQLSATLPRYDDRVEGLTVLMITWNHAGWLLEAVDSARATLAALPSDLTREILILDDGSTDETGAVLARYDGDPFVRVIRSPGNLGLGRARNVLLETCRTRHAVFLYADNRLLADGAATIYHTARNQRSTITYGHVIAATSDGEVWTTFSAPPTRETIRNGQAFDSMCVIDVDAICAVGAYSTDPHLAGVADDYELLNRCLRRGELVAFVPTVIGRYRIAALRHSAGVAHMASVERRIERSYLYDDPEFDSYRIIVAHPQTGIVWATPAACPANPPSATIVPLHLVAPPTTPVGPRILLISSGGVGNLGDDAIAEVVIARIIDAVPDARIEVISDRDAPVTHGPPVPWLGTIAEVWQSLSDQELQLVADRSGRFAPSLTPPVRRDAMIDLAAFDAVHIAGGGNLCNDFAAAQALPRVAIALACDGLGTPVTWSGQGVGPCDDDLLELLGLAAGAAASFTCRDPRSAALMRPATPDCAETADDALDHESATPERLQEVLQSIALPRGPYVVAHVRQAAYATDIDPQTVARAVDELAQLRNASVIAIAIDSNGDPELDLLAHLATEPARSRPWRVVDANDDAFLARAVLARADAVVTCSFHLALWSLRSNTPAVLLESSPYYVSKARALAGTSGIDSIGVACRPLTGTTLDQALRAIEAQLPSTDLQAAADRADTWWSDRLVRWADARAIVS